MNEEEKKKLRELWDFTESLAEECAREMKVESTLILSSVMTKFEELFTKELNEE